MRWDGEEFRCTGADAGTREITVPLNEVVFYIRKDCLVPVAKTTAASTAELDLSDVELLGTGTAYRQYLDDGYTKDCSLERCTVLQKDL